MDPLSLAASISGFLSLSIELSKILGAYISAAKSAPEEASEMLTEVSCLCHVLDILVDTLDSEDSEFGVFENDSVLCTIIRACQTLVAGVHKKLSKKTQQGKQGRQSRFRSVEKMAEVMEQLKWPFQKEECQESVQALHRHVQTLQVLLISSNRSLLTQKASMIIGKLEKQYQTVLGLMSDLANTGAVVDKIASDVGEVRDMLKDEEFDRLLQWISPLEPHKRHHDIRSKRLEDTGTWFLETEEFEKWYNKDETDGDFVPLLGSYGIPGAGKSVMSSLVIDSISTQLSIDNDNTCLAYVYCDYRDEAQQTAVNMIGALLKQILAAQSQHIPMEIVNSLKKRKNTKTQILDLDEAFRFLLSILGNFKTFYICVDALDECNSEQRASFLPLIKNILENYKYSARIFVTGRPHIEQQVHGLFNEILPISIALKADAGDIKRYVEWQLKKDDNYASMDDEFKKEITDTIVATADGMFLLPALQIQSVLDQTSISKRKAALISMPKKLDEAFQITIDRIQRQVSAKSKQGMEVLKWTFMAERPLSVAELRHALAAVDSTSSSHLDHNDLPFEKSLTDYCHGLVVLDKETSSLRLVHKSLQDFLQKQHEKKELFETGHCEIARACLTYMGFSDSTMSSSPAEDPYTIQALINCRPGSSKILKVSSEKLVSPHLERFPLLKYAIHFWGFHAKRQTNQEVTDQIITLFLNEKNSHCISKNLLSVALAIFGSRMLKSVIGVYSNFESFKSDVNTFPGLYITVHFGLESIFEAFVERLHDFDIDLALWKSYCLQTAIVMGRPRIIRTLLDRTDPDIDINAEFADGMTTLLSLASQLQIKNQEAVILLLLQRGADINKRCPRTGLTPLSLAAAWGRYGDSVVRLLLGRGADIESRDVEGRTALSHAASNWRIGNEAIVKLLLNEGADFDCSDYRGRTPLSHALGSDFKVAKLLLNSGANIESRDRDGYTPLLCMLRRLSRMREMSSHEIQPVKSFVLLLLDKGADISVSGNKGRTALSWAAEIGDREIVTYILGKGADVDLSDNNGLSPLSYAARSGDRQTVLHLLEFGADINSRDNSGIAPLSWAAIWGQVEVVDLFLENGSDINSRDNDGRTPLSYAGFCREVVDILLEKGADIDLSDNTERTPLSYAVECGSEETVTLLLEKGADINSRDNKGRTPLSWAVCPADSHPNEGVVRLLLDNGASTNSRDNLGRTPLTMITLKLFCSNLGLGLESLPDSTRELLDKLERLLIERGGTF